MSQLLLNRNHHRTPDPLLINSGWDNWTSSPQYYVGNMGIGTFSSTGTSTGGVVADIDSAPDLYSDPPGALISYKAGLTNLNPKGVARIALSPDRNTLHQVRAKSNNGGGSNQTNKMAIAGAGDEIAEAVAAYTYTSNGTQNFWGRFDNLLGYTSSAGQLKVGPLNGTWSLPTICRVVSPGIPGTTYMAGAFNAYTTSGTYREMYVIGMTRHWDALGNETIKKHFEAVFRYNHGTTGPAVKPWALNPSKGGAIFLTSFANQVWIVQTPDMRLYTGGSQFGPMVEAAGGNNGFGLADIAHHNYHGGTVVTMPDGITRVAAWQDGIDIKAAVWDGNYAARSASRKIPVTIIGSNAGTAYVCAPWLSVLDPNHVFVIAGIGGNASNYIYGRVLKIHNGQIRTPGNWWMMHTAGTGPNYATVNYPYKSHYLADDRTVVVARLSHITLVPKLLLRPA